MQKRNRRIFVMVVLSFMILTFITNGTMHAIDEKRLIMATTTSTESSGLLDILLPPFEAKYGVRVDVVAVGTGKAIEMGKNGDVDIVFVHARAMEDQFVADGFGVNRRDVMYNDFVIAGPKSDPAGIKGLTDVVSAMQKIADSKSIFISRGDNSGTHVKEKEIWAAANVQPKGAWYLEVGQGMGPSLNMAHEKSGYILTDRGTYLAYKGKLDLDVLFEGDANLFNPYGIIPVNPALYSHVNYQMAMAFVGFITSQQGQDLIANYQQFGGQLFYPVAIPQKK